jgi:nicotinamidase-related amidase
MDVQLAIEQDKTAVLIMDYQNKQLSGQPEARREHLLENANKVLAAARSKGLPVIYVEVRSRKGPPEFKPWDIERRQKSGQEDLGKREPLFEIHPEVTPQEGEVVVTKRRIGPFSTTNLYEVLEGLRIETLVLMGISTGGVVLSVVRWAADIDFQIVVLKDACADPDEEVHRVLVEKVIPRQATVVTCDEFLQALG